MSKADVAKRLCDAVFLDIYPSIATQCDFGIDLGGQEVYAIYNRAIKNGEITEEQLSEAACDGEKLTKLLQNVKANPNKIVINTMWDGLPPEEY